MAAAATIAAPSSASGLLAMLSEPHPALKLHALGNLNSLMHLFWPEISTSVPTIESLYEDEEFEQRQLAAFVASKVLRLLVKIYERLPSPDYLTICQCLMFLNDSEGVASILKRLIQSGSKDDALLAFQIAFDLVENEQQAFMLNVKDHLPDSRSAVSIEQSSELDQSVDHGSTGSTFPNATSTLTGGNDRVEDISADGSLDSAGTSCQVDTDDFAKLKAILSGDTSVQLTLQFLYSHNRSDRLILKTIKQSVEMRNSVCHSATICANALMHAGTTVDTFLRENLEWLSRAINWAKFSATAGLGVIHLINFPKYI